LYLGEKKYSYILTILNIMVSDKNIVLFLILIILIFAYMHAQFSCNREGFMRRNLRRFRLTRENFFGTLSNRFTRVKRSIFGKKL
jgi:hypothetical protein